MTDLSRIPSDAAIMKAYQTQQDSPNDYTELYEQYPDEAFTALEAANRLLRLPTICERLGGDELCGGCIVPLD